MSANTPNVSNVYNCTIRVLGRVFMVRELFVINNNCWQWLSIVLTVIEFTKVKFSFDVWLDQYVLHYFLLDSNNVPRLLYRIHVYRGLPRSCLGRGSFGIRTGGRLLLKLKRFSTFSTLWPRPLVPTQNPIYCNKTKLSVHTGISILWLKEYTECSTKTFFAVLVAHVTEDPSVKFYFWQFYTFKTTWHDTYFKTYLICYQKFIKNHRLNLNFNNDCCKWHLSLIFSSLLKPVKLVLDVHRVVELLHASTTITHFTSPRPIFVPTPLLNWFLLLLLFGRLCFLSNHRRVNIYRRLSVGVKVPCSSSLLTPRNRVLRGGRSRPRDDATDGRTPPSEPLRILSLKGLFGL